MTAAAQRRGCRRPLGCRPRAQPPGPRGRHPGRACVVAGFADGIALALTSRMHDAIALECAGGSVVGRRANNEDAWLMRPELGLFVVADGMGGYDGGEVASAAVVAALEGFVARIELDPEGTWPLRERGELGPLEAMLEVGLRVADREVKAQRTGRLARMGSTATVALFRDRRLAIGNVGDSRIYRLRDELEQLTLDHSVAAELQRSGTTHDVSPSFLACLTRAIGMPGDVVPDVHALDVRAGDTYLLCSDGLWGELPDASIALLLRNSTPAQACARLIDAAYAAGSSDNITAIVLRAHASRTMP